MLKYKDKFTVYFKAVLYVLRICLLSLIIGVIIGFCGLMFNFLLLYVTKMRLQHPEIKFLLPIGGIMIVLVYQSFMINVDYGTNQIIGAIREGSILRVRRAPLTVLATAISHLFGASVGREGAALQVGGSLGVGIAKIFHVSPKTKKVLIMAGMSACFQALFNTPLTASIFSIELITVGVLYYSALLPCIIASFSSYILCKILTEHVFTSLVKYLKYSEEVFHLADLPSFVSINALWAILIPLSIAILSILFILMLKYSEFFVETFIKNPYVRIVFFSLVIVLLLMMFDNNCNTYSGAGANLIEESLENTNQIHYYTFILKIMFTVIAVAIGFKGGEIVPALAIAATFGVVIHKITHINLDLCVSISVVSMFCCITNCPIASILIGLELFSVSQDNLVNAIAFFSIASAISYVSSGYFGLYKSQTFRNSKYMFDTEKI